MLLLGVSSDSPTLKPEHVRVGNNGIADIQERIADIEAEIKTVKDSYSEIPIHSQEKSTCLLQSN